MDTVHRVVVKSSHVIVIEVVLLRKGHDLTELVLMLFVGDMQDIRLQRTLLGISHEALLLDPSLRL